MSKQIIVSGSMITKIYCQLHLIEKCLACWGDGDVTSGKAGSDEGVEYRDDRGRG